MSTTLSSGLLSSIASLAATSPANQSECKNEVVGQEHLLQVLSICLNAGQDISIYPNTLLLSDGIYSMRIKADKVVESSMSCLNESSDIAQFSIVLVTLKEDSEWPYVAISELTHVSGERARIGEPKRLKKGRKLASDTASSHSKPAADEDEANEKEISPTLESTSISSEGDVQDVLTLGVLDSNFVPQQQLGCGGISKKILYNVKDTSLSCANGGNADIEKNAESSNPHIEKSPSKSEKVIAASSSKADSALQTIATHIADAAEYNGKLPGNSKNMTKEPQGKGNKIGMITTKLASTSLLSANYVPESFRRINEVFATRMYASAPPCMQFGRDVILVPQQYASVPDNELCPFRTIPVDDSLYFAIEHRHRKLMGTLTSNELPPLPQVESALDLGSYCSTFDRLLTTERQEMALLYERYSQYNHPVTFHAQTKDDSIVYVCSTTVLGIADANPPLQVGDVMLVRSMRPIALPINPAVGRAAGFFPPVIIEIFCTVQSIQRKGDLVHGTWVDQTKHNVLFTAAPSLLSTFNVRFVPQVTKHARCLTALDWLYKQPLDYLSPIIYPSVAPVSPNDDVPLDHGVVYSEDLNLQQRDFLKLVLRRTRHIEFGTMRSPIILTGPAGTGKTNTQLAAVRHVLASDPSAHILMCTPSHAAADNIITRLSKHLDRLQLFRLYDSSRAVETVPVQVLGYTRQLTGGLGEFCIPSRKDLFAFKVIVSTCEDAHILYGEGLTNQQLRVRRKDLANYVAQAGASCNVDVILKGIDSCHFTHLFIDEAAQATEPESLIPVSVVADTAPGVRKAELVLCGDPRQLSPSVYSSQARTAGMGKSWMERLLLRPVGALGGGNNHLLGPDMVSMLDFIQLSFRDNLSIFLTINYRGHPSFLMMPSALFYYDKLQSAVPIIDGLGWCEKLRRLELQTEPVVVASDGTQSDPVPHVISAKKQYGWPIHLRGVKGADKSVTIQSGFAGNSWQNEDEAKVVVELAAELTSLEVSTQSIGIMAPFRAQVVLIRDLLRQRGLGAVNVGLVEDYQAVERDVILLSLTRSNWNLVGHDVQHSMGMFNQPKRSNVAMTRAQKLFIVVGDPRTMMRDFVWRQFLLFCLHLQSFAQMLEP
ncbi:hypothetical protein MPSEU_000416500 [Mayamaea pseudoterrestris]|nr:hypothetical protein MPSEU_000416500 [Mayamaea pseudoterrestris]